MDRRPTLALLIVFAALLVAVLWATRAGGETTAAATATADPRAARPIWSITADQILSVRIEDRTTRRQVQVSRSSPQDSWKLDRPDAVPADQVQAAALAASVANLSAAPIAAALDLTAYGVQSPSYVVEVGLADGRQLRALVGGQTIGQSGNYILVEGETAVGVVQTFNLQSLTMYLDSPPYLATPTPTPLPTATAIEMDEPAETPAVVTPTP